MTAPPEVRGLRAMAILRWALLVAIALLALGTWWRFVVAEPAAAGVDRYYCPMHPQIRTPRPGTCPICSMGLEPIPTDEARDGAGDAGAPPVEAELAPVMLTTERRQRAGIAVVAARRVALEGAERWPAFVEVDEGARAEVRVRAGAFVERLAIRQSDVRVRAGQTLAEVYSPEILRAQEELLLAHRWAAGGREAGVAASARERLELLGMSARDIDAMLASGRARRTIPLRAPISGWITRFEAVLGSYATPETRLYEITDLSRVRVVATPFASDLSWLGPGAEASFVPRGGGAPIALELALIEPEVTEGTRALRVRFRARGAALRPGDIGEVTVVRPPRDAIVVPRDAVIDTGTRRYVFVEHPGGLFEPRAVEVGEPFGEQRAIVSGLEEGERVVARGAFVLDSESRLQSALAPAPRGEEAAR